MKKYSLTILLTVAACLSLPVASFAASITGSTALNGVAFAPSKSVTINTKSAPTAYAVTAIHAQGTEMYGALSSDTKIYYKTVAAGTAGADPTSETALGNELTLTK